MGINLGSLATTPQTDIKAQVAPAAPVIPDGATPVDRGNGVMSLNLNKGVTLNLAKSCPSLTRCKIGLGWDPIVGATMDLDVIAFALHNGKLTQNSDITFYNQLSVTPGITLSGDNRTGDGEGDDEFLTINLAAIPADVTTVSIFVNIHEAARKNQNFGQIKNAYCRLVNTDNDKEEAIYVLNEAQSALFDTFHFVDLVRSGSTWEFKTIGQGSRGDLNALLAKYS